MSSTYYCTSIALCRTNTSNSEPEFRLVFMLPAGIACGFGMFFFGYTLENGSAAELCAFLQGVMMVGVLIGIFSTLSYGLDSFRSQSSEIFVMNMLFKVSHPPKFSSAYFNTFLAEFHVLRSFQLRKPLGCKQWARADHVRVWRHVDLSVFDGYSCIHLWKAHAKLVGTS